MDAMIVCSPAYTRRLEELQALTGQRLVRFANCQRRAVFAASAIAELNACLEHDAGRLYLYALIPTADALAADDQFETLVELVYDLTQVVGYDVRLAFHVRPERMADVMPRLRALGRRQPVDVVALGAYVLDYETTAERELHIRFPE